MLDELSIEEKKVIQGILIEEAEKYNSQTKSLNVFFVIGGVVGLIIGIELFKDLVWDIKLGTGIKMYLVDTILILFISFITLMCIVSLISDIRQKPREQYKKAARNFKFIVKKIFVTKVEVLGTTVDNYTEWFAEIESNDGKSYEKSVPFFHKGSYCEGKGYYVEIPLGYENKMELVIPGKEESPETWDYGLRMYNKYVK